MSTDATERRLIDADGAKDDVASATGVAQRCLVDADGAADGAEVTRAALEQRLKGGVFFWLDLQRPTEDDFANLRDLFGFHPLALEDAEHFDQRAKLDEYDNFVLLVAHGASPDDDGLVEVHCFLSEKFLVTMHRDDCPSFADLRHRLAGQRLRDMGAAHLLYLVVDALVDSFFPVLTELDDALDEVEDRVLQSPDDAQLQELFKMKRKLVGLRKVITPQRDLFARLATGMVEIPGMTPDTERYYRDVYDHLIRISDLVDSYRDLMTGAMDVYLSTVSNKLNEVMKRLTIIATVFMPLSWLTGFFGQNFGALVRNIGGWPAFLGLGIGTELVLVGILLIVFRRRHWL